MKRWSRMNARTAGRSRIERSPTPTRNISSTRRWSAPGRSEPGSAENDAEFVERIERYMLKALHEAKVHSSWINPDADYDQAVQEFVRLILDEEANGTFLDDFRSFQRRVSHLGLFNSLSQTLLKLASPGVPDTYQGTELWDFSLVDPDNRRPVDYPKRAELLRQLQSAVAASNGDMTELCRDLVTAKEDGRIKLYVHYKTLGLRRERPGLLSAGDYFPVACEGSHCGSCLRLRPAIGRRLRPGRSAPAPGLADRRLEPDPARRGGLAGYSSRAPRRDFRRRIGGTSSPANACPRPSKMASSPCPRPQVFAHFPVALLVSGRDA